MAREIVLNTLTIRIPLQSDADPTFCSRYIQVMMYREDDSPFHLKPHRASLAGEPAEYRVEVDGSRGRFVFQVRIFMLNHLGARFEITGNFHPQPFEPVFLELGHTADGSHFSLLAGELVIPFDGSDIPSYEHEKFSMLWPTLLKDDLDAFVFRPSGAFAQGRLPSRLLSLPSPEDEQFDCVLQLAPYQGLRADARRRLLDEIQPGDVTEDDVYWVLDRPSSRSLPNAVGTRDWVDRLSNTLSGMAAAYPAVGGLLDEIAHQAGDGSRIVLFREAERNFLGRLRILRLQWFGSSLKFRLAFGGGSAGESSYYPQYVSGGRRYDPEADHWESLPLRFESHPHWDPAEEPTDAGQRFVIGIDVRCGGDEPTVRLPANSLRLVHGPAWPDDEAAPTDREQLWLQTDRGPLAIKGTAPLEANIDGRAARPGPIAESLDLVYWLSAIAPDQFEVSDLSGLSIRLRSITQSKISLWYDPETERLVFLVTDPMVSLLTPPVWYERYEADAQHVGPPNPLAAPAGDLGAFADNAEGWLGQRFTRAEFVSENVVEQIGPTPAGAVSAALSFEITHGGETSQRLVLTISANEFAYWVRLPNWPLLNARYGAGNLRRQSDSVPTIVPVAQKALEGEVVSRAVVFPAAGLPACKDSPRLENLELRGGWEWNCDDRLEYYHAGLPPLTVLPALGQWRIRRGSPILDTVFANTFRDLIEQASADPARKRQVALVVNHVAFRLDATAAQPVVGYLPEQSDTPPLTVRARHWPASVADTPLSPKVHLTFSQDGVSVERELPSSNYDLGLGFSLKVDWRLDGAVPNPRTVIVADSDPSANARVVRGGQQLLAVKRSDLNPEDGGEIVVCDGAGRQIAEPVEAQQWVARVNSTDRWVMQRRTESLPLQAGALEIELISRFCPPDEMLEPPPSFEPDTGWFAHNGSGGPPSLFGFSVLPRSCASIADAGPVTQLLLEGDLTWDRSDHSKRESSSGDARTDRFFVAEASFSTLELNYHRTGERADAWTHSAAGELDWRFSEPDAVDGARLIRLTATIDAEAPSTALPLSDVRLWFRHPVGILQLVLPPETAARLEAGAVHLSLPARADGVAAELLDDQTGFGFSFPDWTISREEMDEPILCRGLRLSWRLSEATIGNGVEMRLYYQERIDDDPARWWFVLEDSPELTIADEDRLSIVRDLDELPTSADRFLFVVKTEALTNSRIPADSWFREPNGPSGPGLLQIEFETIDDPPGRRWTRLEGHFLLRLVGRDEQDETTDIAAQIQINHEITARLSGCLKLSNAIAYKRLGDADPLEHSMTAYFLRMAMPVDLIFRGRMPVGVAKVASAAIVDHHWKTPSNRRFSWQSAQRCDWMRLDSYSSTYGVELPEGENPDTLVLDMGSVFAMTADPTLPPPEAIPALRTNTLSLTLSPWRPYLLHCSVAGEEIKGCEHSRPSVWFARVPIAARPAPSSPIKTIQIQEGASQGLRFDRLGEQPSTLQLPPTPTVGSQELRLFERLPSAAWLDANFLSDMLRPPLVECGEERIDWTPVFPQTGTRQYVKELPDRLGDFAPLLATDPAFERFSVRALISPYDSSGHMVSLRYARIANYPFELQKVPTVEPTTETARLQLIVDESEGLRLLARGEVELPANPKEAVKAAEAWGRQRLRENSRVDAAVVVVERRTSFMATIPRALAKVRLEGRRLPTWRLEAAPAFPVDSDRLLQRRPICDAEASRRFEGTIASLADAELNAFTFTANPIQREDSERQPAATHFRLLRAAGPVEHAGRLRAPLIGPENDSDFDFVYSLSEATRVEFQAVADQSYPEVNLEAIHQPAGYLLRAELGQGIESDEPTRTLLPPLIEVIEWAERPGERSHLSFGMRRQNASAPAESQTVRAGAISTLGLDAPHARAAKVERISFEVAERRRVFHRQYELIQLNLEQTVAVTPPPSPRELSAVLTNTRLVHPARPTVEQADSEPALLSRTILRFHVDGGEHALPVGDAVSYRWDVDGVVYEGDRVVVDDHASDRTVIALLDRPIGPLPDSGRSSGGSFVFHDTIGEIRVKKVETTVGDIPHSELTLTAHRLFAPSEYLNGKSIALTTVFWSFDPSLPAKYGDIPDESKIVPKLPALDHEAWKKWSANTRLFPLQNYEFGGTTVNARKRLLDGLWKAQQDGLPLYLFAVTFENSDVDSEVPNEPPDWEPVDPNKPLWCLKVEFVESGKAAQVPSLHYAVQSKYSVALEGEFVQGTGRGALNDEDFTTITPAASGSTPPSDESVRWVRRSAVSHLEPLPPFHAEIAAPSFVEYHLKIFGVSGESILIERRADSD